MKAHRLRKSLVRRLSKIAQKENALTAEDASIVLLDLIKSHQGMQREMKGFIRVVAKMNRIPEEHCPFIRKMDRIIERGRIEIAEFADRIARIQLGKTN